MEVRHSRNKLGPGAINQDLKQRLTRNKAYFEEDAGGTGDAPLRTRLNIGIKEKTVPQEAESLLWVRKGAPGGPVTQFIFSTFGRLSADSQLHKQARQGQGRGRNSEDLFHHSVVLVNFRWQMGT